MAVRNLAAILRQGTMIAEAKKNEYQLKKENVWKRIDIIRASKEDAIDAIDTMKALVDNGMRDRLYKWEVERHLGLNGAGEFTLSLGSCRISFNPRTDEVIFTWSNCALCESYSTQEFPREGVTRNGRSAQYFIERITHKDRRYDELLTRMAAEFKPYLDAFFAWVDTI